MLICSIWWLMCYIFQIECAFTEYFKILKPWLWNFDVNCLQCNNLNFSNTLECFYLNSSYYKLNFLKINSTPSWNNVQFLFFNPLTFFLKHSSNYNQSYLLHYLAIQVKIHRKPVKHRTCVKLYEVPKSLLE